MLAIVDNTLISFINFQRLDLSIALFNSLLDYIHLITTKKLMYLNCLICYYHCIIDLLCLLLLRALLELINFIIFQRFDSLIIPYISILEYSPLQIIKKLINFDYLACCCHHIINSIFCLVLLSPSTLSCYWRLSCLIITIFVVDRFAPSRAYYQIFL